LNAARTPLRRIRLRAAPLRATPQEVQHALGGLSVAEALRGSALSALPSVADFERGLAEMADEERSELTRVADDVVAHRFDLLGSGPVELGPEIDWQCDFKTGRRWPLVHVSKVPVSFDDASDIKVPWELSRFQHLPMLAAAFRATGKGRYVAEIESQLSHWIAANPVEFGANWVTTMDVAIRAANWIAALALIAGEQDAPWIDDVASSLLLHGRFIRGHLEWSECRGNHYLSDVVGLLVVAALFVAGDEGRGWSEWAVDALIGEMGHQVHPDGCDHEASVPYHRLVAELFLHGSHAADAVLPGRLPGWYRERLDRMLDFTAAYARPDGLAPQIGDADDGRFLPLDDYGQADPRSHLHLFRQASRTYVPATGCRAFPDGGYFVLRNRSLYAIVRCGDTGLRGAGGHGHNDQLSFELCAGDVPLVVDPGAYLYTADPAARNEFRSTAFHSTLRVDGAEQNDFVPGQLFVLPDRSRADAVHVDATVFEGRHHGFEVLDPPAVHTRRIELRDDGLAIRDTVESSGSHLLEWTFTMPPGDAPGRDGEARFRTGGRSLEIASPGLEFTVEDGWYSPSYGRRVRAPFIRARRESLPRTDVTDLMLRVS
jgi:hypothetical protein